jgi:hypothetical protein
VENELSILHTFSIPTIGLSQFSPIDSNRTLFQPARPNVSLNTLASFNKSKLILSTSNSSL